MFLGKGVRLGRIGGIEIRLDYSWFVIFGLFLFLLATGYLPVVAPNEGTAAYWLIAAVMTVLFFGSVLGHELSHAVVARRAGTPINTITLFILGGMAQMEDEPQTAFNEFKMAIAGPIASLGFAAVFFALSMVAGALGSRLAFFALTYLWFINVILAVFNLLPGFPLDGGRVFRAAIWGATGNLRTATRVASITGQVFGWAFILIGIGSLFIPAIAQYGNIWFALIGWFLVSAARQSYQQVVMRETLTSVQVGTLMNPQVDAVPAGMSVERLVTDYFLRESAWTLPVEHDGNVIGTVSVEDVRNLPRDRWTATLVGEIVHPLGDAEMLAPQETAWTAANRMSNTNSDRMLVTDDRGHIAGIVTRGAISRWLQAHSKLQPGTA